MLVLWLFGPAQPARAEWNVGAYLGGTRTQQSFLRVKQPALGASLQFRGVEYDGGSFEPPLYYGLRSGYFFHRRFGVEAEFIHLKVFAQVQRVVEVDGTLRGAAIHARVPMNTIVGRFSISHGVNLLLGNAVLRQDFWRPDGEKLGRLALSARVGLGGLIPHPESEILGAAEEHYEAAGPALQVAGGAEFWLWRGLYLLGEYKYTRARPELRVAAGTAETLLHTHHAVFGLSYHF